MQNPRISVLYLTLLKCTYWLYYANLCVKNRKYNISLYLLIANAFFGYKQRPLLSYVWNRTKITLFLLQTYLRNLRLSASQTSSASKLGAWIGTTGSVSNIYPFRDPLTMNGVRKNPKPRPVNIRITWNC